MCHWKPLICWLRVTSKEEPLVETCFCILYVADCCSKKKIKKCPAVKLFFIKLLIVMQPCVMTLCLWTEQPKCSHCAKSISVFPCRSSGLSQILSSSRRLYGCCTLWWRIVHNCFSSVFYFCVWRLCSPDPLCISLYSKLIHNTKVDVSWWFCTSNYRTDCSQTFSDFPLLISLLSVCHS